MKKDQINKTASDSDLSVSSGSFSSDEIEMILSGLWRLADTSGNYGDGETKRAANKLHDKIKKMNIPVISTAQHEAT